MKRNEKHVKESYGDSSNNSITNVETLAATYTFNVIPFIKKDTFGIQFSFNVKETKYFSEMNSEYDMNINCDK